MQQAAREEELKVARKHASDLEAEVADLSREVELRQEQEDALKEVRLPLRSAALLSVLSQKP